MQYFLPSKAQQCPRLPNQLTARALISYNSRAVQNLKVVLSKRKRVFSVLWFMFTLHVLLTAGLLCLREDEKEGCIRSSSYDKRYPRCPDCAATAKTYVLLWNVCSLYYMLVLNANVQYTLLKIMWGLQKIVITQYITLFFYSCLSLCGPLIIYHVNILRC